MLGTALDYFLRHPVRAVRAFTRDPIEGLTTIHDQYVSRRERQRPQMQYDSDPDWEGRLHGLLGAGWPCEAWSEFNALWPKVMSELKGAGIDAGPESFGCWNDGDAGLVRAIWCLTRHLKPRKVIETGVAHGVTSRFILEALDRNGAGRLWSIDLPPLIPTLHSQIGVAVGNRYADRWSFVEGSSRRRLPGLLSELGEIDLFVHDSLHSERNVRFELDLVWKHLRKGGAIVVDDIDSNWGFRSFIETYPECRSIICEAEPLRPDTRRFNKKGLFGIILK